jgi:hypothetical protein
MPNQKKPLGFRGFAFMATLIAALVGIFLLYLYNAPPAHPAAIAHKAPPYSAMLDGPKTAHRGDLVMYDLFVRNNTSRQLTLHAGLSYFQDQDPRRPSSASTLSIGDRMKVLRSNIPFSHRGEFCPCLGKPWTVVLGPAAYKSYWVIVKPTAHYQYCLDANFDSAKGAKRARWCTNFRR